MSTAAVPPPDDPVRPTPTSTVTVTLDGERFTGQVGQTLAGLLLGAGRAAWRRTSGTDRPRGVFCGIGVCFDCLAEVNGVRDVRLCQRTAADGDAILTQRDLRPQPREEADA